MDERVKKLINSAVIKIIENTSSDEKIKSLVDKHCKKIHFIPHRYRVFGGLLQSMNIQFGNFIETLMELLIESDGKYKILRQYSGKKNNTFKLSTHNDSMIDNYISKCQVEDINLEIEFPKLLKEIIKNKDGESNSFKHDIDLLFEHIETGKIYYLECKYNDDHDTGKFVDINRKFIKTYAYLVKEFNIEESSIQKLTPILFFFTNKKMKGNIYIPENTNIKRGKKFFDEFLTVTYNDVDNYLSNLSEDDNTIYAFNELYKKIVTEKVVKSIEINKPV